jgi:hypothetical protein
MVLRISVFCVCLLLPHIAVASTLVSFDDGFVTWEAVGVLNRSTLGHPNAPPLPRPPVGTPFSLSLTFDPSAAVPTPNAFAPDCLMVPVSASLTLGGISYTSGGLGFTHAALPGTNCSFSEHTQFSLHNGFTTTQDDPWGISDRSNLLIASYHDLLVQDAFPGVPTGHGSFWLQYQFPDVLWEIGGPFAPVAVDVEQPAPVPEPGTMMLFGVGLAAVARRLRRT